MAMLLIQNATLPDGRSGIDLLARDGRFVEVAPKLVVPEGAERLDAQGWLLSPPFVDAHFHMDSVLSHGLPRVNQSGTLLEGIALWGELKPLLTEEALIERALRYCDWAVAERPVGDPLARRRVRCAAARGARAAAGARARAPVPRPAAGGVSARRRVALSRRASTTSSARSTSASTWSAAFRTSNARRPRARPACRLLCELAAERGLRVDMHCDETDDPLSRHVETLAFEAQRLKLHGRVTGSHLTSMHSMDNAYATKLIALMADAGLSVVANPLINITLQGRYDSYPEAPRHDACARAAWRPACRWRSATTA
mgnify:CR=1 FL=1